MARWYSAARRRDADVPDRRAGVFCASTPVRGAPMHMPTPAFRLMVATALLCSAPALSAATFSVGPASDCTHASLQGALGSAANNSGADVVRIVRTATWTGIQVSTD